MGASGDLPGYLAHIGYDGPREPSLDVLRKLQVHHVTRIAFEGLDPFLRRPVSLDPEAISAKLVHGRRGGYCHEHNALFHDVLAAFGFDVVPLGARVVWMQPDRDAPLTHRMTQVMTAEGPFIADVGFGGQTPPAPLRLEPGLEQVTSHGAYRMQRDGDLWEAQMRLPDRWAPMYRFTLARQSRADFEMANWFTSTHPRTRFVSNLVMARIVGPDRVAVLNRTLSVRHQDGTVEERTLAAPEELEAVLMEVMEIAPPVPIDAIWARLPQEPAATRP